jgi:hypothetical protein
MVVRQVYNTRAESKEKRGVWDPMPELTITDLNRVDFVPQLGTLELDSVLSIWFSTMPRLVAITCFVSHTVHGLIMRLKICIFTFVTNYAIVGRGVISGNRITWTWRMKTLYHPSPLSPPIPLHRRKFTVSGGYIICRHPLSHHSGCTTNQLVFLRRLLHLLDVSSISRCRRDRAHRWPRKMPPGKYSLNFISKFWNWNLTKAIGRDYGSNFLTSLKFFTIDVVAVC